MGHVQSVDVESVIVPIRHSENPEESMIYINNHVIKENGGVLMSTFFGQPNAETPLALLKGSATKWPEADCLGEREKLPDGSVGEYKYISYKATYERVIQFGKGLLTLGVKKGDKIGIYAHNSIWWQTIAFGAYSIGAIVVPVYDSLGPDASEYIVNHADISILFVSGFKYKNALALLPKIPNVSKLIIMQEEEPEEKPESIDFRTIQQVYEAGANTDLTAELPDPNDLALIMYTSGSTGTPKGCMLSHLNIVAGSAGLSCVNMSCSPVETYLSFLPLAHIYAQAVELEVLAHGGRVGYARGPVSMLIDDIQHLQPTIMTAVPRILNRVADKMKSQIEELPSILQKVLKIAMAEKVRCMKENRGQSLILDGLLFNKFRASLGGKLRLIVSGGAPIMPEVFEFLCATVTPNILQGCGLTELSSACFVQELPVADPDTVGLCCPTVELKLRPVKDMPQYDPNGEEPTGELLARGANMFKGYYKQPELTNEAIVDGWFATGDVGKVTKGMQVKIIDRVKQLVKLSQGEYISLTTLTETYSLASAVLFIYVHADSKHSEPIAIVWPTHELQEKWRAAGINDIINSDVAKKEIVDSLRVEHEKRKLRGFEKINHIIIKLEEPTVENGLLTPSQKAQLTKIKNKYIDELNALYDSIQ
ncbi:putative AMP-binding enzyme protein [Tritrichomonas foetus]|uniref:AMP-binding enzyme protein n=1 Tax=Tritrichomonas foetus TaxID=1144522 RepID=A0A1J4JJ74_9EUKA|nr:putative AMP-binding enzyme protein [Tritrichomonas foetus]|eukprot:OHS97611.1 putative AMP-binding enzyme protein [Tritrichomonas foetus]